jgi:flagellar export protein FliJ
MGFQFSLAAVLRIRGMVEEREERLLRQILMEIAQTVERLESNQRALDRAYASLSEGAAEPGLGHELHAAYGQVKELTQTRTELSAHRDKLLQMRDQQLTVYHSAHRDRDMLTTMQQQQRNAYDAAMARREQKLLDDNYIARRNRR